MMMVLKRLYGSSTKRRFFSMTGSMMRLILLGSLLFIASGCGGPPPIPVHERVPSVRLLWPVPPEKPRIEYLYSLSKPDDVGAYPSFLERVGNFLAGTKPQQQMVRPYGTYFGADETLYVADPGSQAVHVFQMKSRRYRQITRYGKRELVSPVGVAQDRSGFLYVADSALRRIFVFGPQGEPMREIGSDEQFDRPAGIAIHPLEDRLYVADAMTHSIHVFRLTGEALFSFGRRGTKEGEFNFPTSLTFDREARLYVNDSLNYRIQVFNADGRFVRYFGRHGDAMGEFSSPKGVAVDTEGHIYVADAIFDTVQIFDGQGQLLLYFGEAGQAPGEFWMPSSIFIDQANRIFVTDSYNQRVQVFRFLGGT
jgi:DNA-binding beta-propeller fold protein YncE